MATKNQSAEFIIKRIPKSTNMRLTATFKLSRTLNLRIKLGFALIKLGTLVIGIGHEFEHESEDE